MENKEKQIEEVSRIASKCITSWLNNETSKALPDYIAEALYNASYRKSTYLAEEIFVEIEKLKYNGWSDVNIYPCIDYVGLAELKKRYIGDKHEST